MSSKQSAHFTMFSQTRVRFLNHKCALALPNSNGTQSDDTVTQTNRTEETMLFIYCAPSHSQSSKPKPASRSFFVWNIEVSLIYHDMRETKSSLEITGSTPLRAVVIIDSSRLTASDRWKPRYPTHACGWAFIFALAHHSFLWFSYAFHILSFSRVPITYTGLTAIHNVTPS